MIRLHRATTGALLLFTLFATACSGQKTLRILHTNDMHAGYVPHEAFWIQSDPKPMVGGFKELAWDIDSIRPLLPATFLLDAGDVMTGTPIADFAYHGYPGGALFEMMNAMKYDAWEIGNHDLDISQANLRGLTSLLHFPTLSANLVDSAGKFPLNNKPYTIIEHGDVKIGVIGIMSRELFQLTNTNNLKGLVVASPIEAAQRYVDSLQGKVDIVVALTHQGVDEDSLLALGTHGIGIIIGGHSHTRLKSAKTINGVVICQTGSNCENLGVLDVTIDDHKVVSSNERLLSLWSRHQEAKTEVSALVDEVQAAIDKDFHGVIGALNVDWKRNAKGESNIGWFIADVLREGGGADFGITNSSGIRKDLTAGPLHKSDLYEVMPFRNTLCTFAMKGKDVRALALRFVRGLHEGRSSLQLAGLDCTWRMNGENPEIVSLTIGGKDVVDDQEYRCATSDFLVNQGEKYIGFAPSSVTYAQETIYDLMVKKVVHDNAVDGNVKPHFKQLD